MTDVKSLKDDEILKMSYVSAPDQPLTDAEWEQKHKELIKNLEEHKD